MKEVEGTRSFSFSPTFRLGFSVASKPGNHFNGFQQTAIPEHTALTGEMRQSPTTLMVCDRVVLMSSRRIDTL
jgi:hypothetical protein